MMLSVHSDEHFMKQALLQARLAAEEGEVPVGAVIVAENRIIAKAYNQTERLNDATAHAEMLAITAAQNFLGNKYLSECALYVTLEPCVMCGGALYWTQLGKLVYGAADEARGYSNKDTSIVHPKTKVFTGVLKDECSALVTKFFKKLRNQ